MCFDSGFGLRRVVSLIDGDEDGRGIEKEGAEVSLRWTMGVEGKWKEKGR